MYAPRRSSLQALSFRLFHERKFSRKKVNLSALRNKCGKNIVKGVEREREMETCAASSRHKRSTRSASSEASENKTELQKKKTSEKTKSKIRYGISNEHFPYMNYGSGASSSVRLSIQYIPCQQNSLSQRAHTQLDSNEMRTVSSQSQELILFCRGKRKKTTPSGDQWRWGRGRSSFMHTMPFNLHLLQFKSSVKKFLHWILCALRFCAVSIGTIKSE